MTALATVRSRVAASSQAPLGPCWPIELLWESVDRGSPARVRGGALPLELGSRFAARLEIPLRTDRPTVIAGFVASLDGVAALDRTGASGGREVSGDFEPDRFVMGLLRATADAVVIGAGTVRASRSHGWAPEDAHPASSAGYAAWRRSLGLRDEGPVPVLVSATGSLDARQLGARADRPLIVATTTMGAGRLARLGRHDHVEVVAIADGPRMPIGALMSFLERRGFGLVLSEGGPTLFGELLAARAVDEIFLTIAPQLAGRSDQVGRRSLVDGTAFPPGQVPWARLQRVMRAGDHLFLRYQFQTAEHGEPT